MIKNMITTYQTIETSPKEIILSDGTIVKPIATLIQTNNNQNIYQIINIQDCWVLCHKNIDTGRYELTPYIFYEAQEVIKTLDRPDKMKWELFKNKWENDPEKTNYDIWPELFSPESSYYGHFRSLDPKQCL